MSKELWTEAYAEKYDECIETMTPQEANLLAVEWAEGAAEREQEHIEYCADAARDR